MKTPRIAVAAAGLSIGLAGCVLPLYSNSDDDPEAAGGNVGSPKGGVGGASGSGTAGGAAGTASTPDCTVASHCGSPTECQTFRCVDNACVTDFVPAGTVVSSQVKGDCRENVCDGSGNVTSVSKDSDVPSSGNVCLEGHCVEGEPVHTNVAGGTPCGAQLTCDGKGSCSGCSKDADCPGTESFCQSKKCTAGVCGWDYKPKGTKATGYSDTPPCKQTQCDGKGSAEVVSDPSNTPPGTACTVGACNGGTPTQNNLENGTECGGDKTCYNGACSGCLTALDCPGSDTFCQARKCVAGGCGFDFKTEGTEVPGQSETGSCKKTVCNGAGGTTVVTDTTNAPAGTGCTYGVCTGGTPSQSDAANGTPCGGSMTCFNGACSGCATAADCPGSDTFCRKRKCVAGACGFDDTPDGTKATGYPDPGYCKQTQCNGAGGTKTVNDNTYRPSDTPCTTYTCTSGSLSQSTKSVGAACTGGVCNASADCVECVNASTCGVDTFCATRTCTGYKCGVSYKGNGTALPAADQTAGNCQKKQCNGSGTVVSVADNGNTPEDVVCKKGTCSSGSPSYTNMANGTSCGVAGSPTCNAGTCYVTQTASLVAAGEQHACAITSGGGVKCWGDNGGGQLGDGTFTDRRVATQVSGLTSGVAAIAAGGWFTCALKTDFSIVCWGNNAFGQLGDGTTTNDKNAPTALAGGAKTYVAIAAGSQSACALDYQGVVWCWGANYQGSVGDGSNTNMRQPTQVDTTARFLSLGAGWGSTCAVRTTGGIMCWGDGAYGKLSTGNTNSTNKPVASSYLSSGIGSVSVGGRHACALTTAGAARCWGQNDTCGTLGNNSTTDSFGPVNVSNLSSGVSSISANSTFSCAVASGAGVQCWGANPYGNLGNNSTTLSRIPVQVSSLTSGVSAVSTGYYFACARLTSGAVRCWGRNHKGQLGNNTITDSWVPVPVSSF